MGITPLVIRQKCDLAGFLAWKLGLRPSPHAALISLRRQLPPWWTTWQS